jgi:hypothetical protein
LTATPHPHFKRHTHVGKTPDGDLYVTVEWQLRNGRDELSLTGVIGPKVNGNCRGSCGQTGVPDDMISYAEGWDAESATRLAEVWDRWHLNAMRAGSPSQEAWLREHPVTAVYPESYLTKARTALAAADLQPDASLLHDGEPYSYGSAWLYEQVPESILTWLANLPDNAERLPDIWKS